MDDGCDLVSLLHSERPEQIKEVLAGTEETTTGVIRLKAMAADGALGFPVVAVNEAQTKHLFDNRYGTGQSTLDGILRATNILIAGRKVVVAGYGWVGRGIASRMHGMGAHVAIIEVDPVRALEALMDGYQVMTAAEAAPWGELFVTATGNLNVFRREHFAAMRDGAIMANSGHFDAELDLKALREMAEGHVREVRENVQEFDLGGKKVHLIAEGRLVNLGAAEGHPAAVMDMSFANQALSAEYVAGHHAELQPRVYVVPEAIDAEVARLKLAALGITLDEMTPSRRTTSPRGSTGPDDRLRRRPDRDAVRRLALALRDRAAHEGRDRLRRDRCGRRPALVAGRPGGRGRPTGRSSGASPTDRETRLTPEGFNARSPGPRVRRRRVRHRRRPRRRLRLRDRPAEPGRRRPGVLEPLTPADHAWRFADLSLDRRRNRLLAIREDHDPETLARHGEAENDVVAIDLADGAVTVLAEGTDFFSAPRLSPDGSRSLAAVGPPEPAVGRDGAGRRRPRRRRSAAARPARRRESVRLDRPAALVA